MLRKLRPPKSSSSSSPSFAIIITMLCMVLLIISIALMSDLPLLRWNPSLQDFVHRPLPCQLEQGSLIQNTTEPIKEQNNGNCQLQCVHWWSCTLPHWDLYTGEGDQPCVQLVIFWKRAEMNMKHHVGHLHCQPRPFWLFCFPPLPSNCTSCL